MTLEEIVFNEAYDAFAGDAEEIPYKVQEYWDEKNQKSIDIFTGIHTPYENVNSYSTLGLSQYTANLQSKGKILSVEFVSACDSSYPLFPNVISTCAFQVMDGKQNYGPGAVISNVISMYYPTSDMKHMWMAYPFLWDDAPHTLTVQQKLVAWLQLIPISDKEYQYLLTNGCDALEELFEREQVEVLNLNRKSVLL